MATEPTCAVVHWLTSANAPCQCFCRPTIRYKLTDMVDAASGGVPAEVFSHTFALPVGSFGLQPWRDGVVEAAPGDADPPVTPDGHWVLKGGKEYGIRVLDPGATAAVTAAVTPIKTVFGAATTAFGPDALHRLAAAFYRRVFHDTEHPTFRALFTARASERHAAELQALWLSEMLGDTTAPYTARFGAGALATRMLHKHPRDIMTEENALVWVQHMSQALGDAWPSPPAASDAHSACHIARTSIACYFVHFLGFFALSRAARVKYAAVMLAAAPVHLPPSPPADDPVPEAAAGVSTTAAL